MVPKYPQFGYLVTGTNHFNSWKKVQNVTIEQNVIIHAFAGQGKNWLAKQMLMPSTNVKVLCPKH